jgi:hypothetical protein
VLVCPQPVATSTAEDKLNTPSNRERDIFGADYLPSSRRSYGLRALHLPVTFQAEDSAPFAVPSRLVWRATRADDDWLGDGIHKEVDESH